MYSKQKTSHLSQIAGQTFNCCNSNRHQVDHLPFRVHSSFYFKLQLQGSRARQSHLSQIAINCYIALCFPSDIKSSPLQGHSGSIQASINLEISSSSIQYFDLLIEGINGQLPNLDLVNMVGRLCGQQGIAYSLHTQVRRINTYIPPICCSKKVSQLKANGYPLVKNQLWLLYNATQCQHAFCVGLPQNSKSNAPPPKVTPPRK